MNFKLLKIPVSISVFVFAIAFIFCTAAFAQDSEQHKDMGITQEQATEKTTDSEAAKLRFDTATVNPADNRTENNTSNISADTLYNDVFMADQSVNNLIDKAIEDANRICADTQTKIDQLSDKMVVGTDRYNDAVQKLNYDLQQKIDRIAQNLQRKTEYIILRIVRKYADIGIAIDTYYIDVQLGNSTYQVDPCRCH